MSLDGTRAHLSGPGGLPPLVERAARHADRLGFGYSCRPEQGRLLRALAAGARRIGETGTGCGVGLAWLASGMREDATAVSVERDAGRAHAAAELFAGLGGRVTVRHADWTAIAEHAPFDLLVLDGGGNAKTPGPAADPVRLLRPGGVLVIDDFTPSRGLPLDDPPRTHWLTHPALRTVEIPLAPDLSTLVATLTA